MMRKWSFLFIPAVFLSSLVSVQADQFFELSEPGALGTIAGAGVLNLTSNATKVLRGVDFVFYSDSDCNNELGTERGFGSGGATGEQLVGPKSMTFNASAVASLAGQAGLTVTQVRGVTFRPFYILAALSLFSPGTSQCFSEDCSSGTACYTSTDQQDVIFSPDLPG